MAKNRFDEEKTLPCCSDLSWKVACDRNVATPMTRVYCCDLSSLLAHKIVSDLCRPTLVHVAWAGER